MGRGFNDLRRSLCRPGGDVYLGPVKLGRLFEETLRIEDHLGRLKRINV
jgi:hypothetical protein